MQTQIWQDVAHLTSEGYFLEAIDLLEREVNNFPSLSNCAQAWQQLAGLYRFNQQDPNVHKAIRYAFMAGEAFVQMGRIAPSIAMYKWLEKCPEGNEQAEKLRQVISKTFARELGIIPPVILATFKTLEGTVSFDKSDILLSRQQWNGGPRPKTLLFSTLKASEIHHLIAFATTRDLAPGSILFREGDKASCFYIVVEGELELSSSAGLKKIFREGDFFGEIALFAEKPRTATTHTKVGAVVLEFSEEKLKDCIILFPHLGLKIREFYELRLFLHIALRTPFFQGLSEQELEGIFQFFKTVSLPSNSMLVKQGDLSDRFYFVVKGYCEVVRDGVPLAQLGPGQFLGEIGVIRSTPRTATVWTLTACEILECHADVFKDFCQRYPKIRIILEQIAEARQPEPNSVDEMSEKIMLVD